MRKLLYLLFYWIPPIVWMGMIFYMSSQPRLTMTQQSSLDFIIFKTLHMVEYGLLFFLLYRAFHSVQRLNEMAIVVSSLFVTVAYAASDELHQLFIPSRQGKLRDVFIDLAGMLVIYVMIKTVKVLQKLL